mmetsp:Transcript_35823/g.79751  ORF Transcript_35823/g.79751 Transcript_35823/m.79751 type:complete len:251 (-) Transcript_35823:343-1095(-)
MALEGARPAQPRGHRQVAAQPVTDPIELARALLQAACCRLKQIRRPQVQGGGDGGPRAPLPRPVGRDGLRLRQTHPPHDRRHAAQQLGRPVSCQLILHPGQSPLHEPLEHTGSTPQSRGSLCHGPPRTLSSSSSSSGGGGSGGAAAGRLASRCLSCCPRLPGTCRPAHAASCAAAGCSCYCCCCIPPCHTEGAHGSADCAQEGQCRGATCANTAVNQVESQSSKGGSILERRHGLLLLEGAQLPVAAGLA